MRPLLSALAVSALCRVAYVSAAHDPRVTFLRQPPDCALWSVTDGGCLATPEELIDGRGRECIADGGQP